MTNENILAYATLLLALATAAGVVTGFVFYRRQCNAQVFLEYTRRYGEVMNMFPADARRARLDLFAAPPPESEDLTLAVLRYLNLSSEEFYLCEKGYLSKDVWRIWEAELKRTLCSPLVTREWKKIQTEFSSYPEFLEYVVGAQGEGLPKSPRGNMDGKQLEELTRLEARIGAFEDLKAEIEPWLMEERDVSAREALDNVIAHVDAEVIELHRRRSEIESGAQT